jgi:transposase InsO family protein
MSGLYAGPSTSASHRPDKAFHIDIAEVRTESGKLHLFVAIDRTSKFAFAQLHDRASRRIAADFLRALIAAVPYTIHTVLTDNGTQFTELASFRHSLASTETENEPDGPGRICRIHAFDCQQHNIEHRLTKPNHPWTNGQVERMNRTLKEATVRAYHYENRDQLQAHLAAFLDAYNFAKRLKPYEGSPPTRPSAMPGKKPRTASGSRLTTSQRD